MRKDGWDIGNRGNEMQSSKSSRLIPAPPLVPDGRSDYMSPKWLQSLVPFEMVAGPV